VGQAGCRTGDKYLGEVAAKIRDRTEFFARVITEGTGRIAWNIAAILN
jgi:hypothetical protein